jgi:hypothetical protein
MPNRIMPRSPLLHPKRPNDRVNSLPPDAVSTSEMASVKPVQRLVQVNRCRSGQFTGSIVSMSSDVWQEGVCSMSVRDRQGMFPIVCSHREIASWLVHENLRRLHHPKSRLSEAIVTDPRTRTDTFPVFQRTALRTHERRPASGRNGQTHA